LRSGWTKPELANRQDGDNGGHEESHNEEEDTITPPDTNIELVEDLE
jgi:hypothetical protein